MNHSDRILVTRPFLPPKAEYDEMLNRVWDSCWLTNDGPMVRELEATLEERWGVGNVIFMTNGTVVLQIALKALGITGKVITTPFSYVATLTSIIWEGCEPVFVDVDKASFNINADLIEEAIDKGVEAILATHVFGNPCDVERIKIIADKYDLKVIYDAAHCFDALTSGSSLLSHGDVSTISFHATKLFHTVEGGALITDDQEIAYRARKMRNFGHNGPLLFDGVGINGKNSEFHAAMGLVNLAHMPEVLKRRREQFRLYMDLLDKDHLSFQKLERLEDYNCAYVPVVFNSEKQLLEVEAALLSSEIESRRYFNPSLNTLDYVQYKSCPESERIAETILCLPVYHELSMDKIRQICSIINASLSDD